MGKFSFDEDDDKQEPTFSLADFKKWLTKQGKGDPNLKVEEVTEAVEEPLPETKEEFKEKLRKRRSKKKED